MTPTTNAGRALLDDLAPIEAWRDSVMRASQQSVRDSFARDISAIEAEAAEAARAEVAANLNAAYRERNAVVAALIRTHPEWPCWLRTAPDADGWWIVYAETPEGQVSWHFGPDDLDLFGGIENANGEAWDGHTTEEKYRRLAILEAAPKDAGTWCREHSTFDACPETCPRGGGYWHGRTDCRYSGTNCAAPKEDAS